MADENNENQIDREIPDATEEAADDVAFEPEDNETHANSFGRSKGDEVSKLKERIKTLEGEKQEYLDGWQRSKAEFVNLRRRDEEEKRELVKFANQNLIVELLPALDSFEMAFANKEAWEKTDKNWRTGVEYIHSQLQNVLAQNGLKPIKPIGETYDPIRDEAVETVRVENESEDGKILSVIQVGYELNGKELRAPKVKVGHFEK